MTEIIKIRGTERLCSNSTCNEKIYVVYLDKEYIEWINSLISKQKVIEKIRFCIKNNLSMKRLVKELGLE
jgi:uncharacterized protein YlbG (UPF0298 family)